MESPWVSVCRLILLILQAIIKCSKYLPISKTSLHNSFCKIVLIAESKKGTILLQLSLLFQLQFTPFLFKLQFRELLELFSEQLVLLNVSKSHFNDLFRLYSTLLQLLTIPPCETDLLQVYVFHLLRRAIMKI